VTAETMRGSRYDEPYRPQYHFSPAANWANDPNGLIYYKGEYHLFYQHEPHRPTFGQMHWGHAVSADLIHWVHLPVALYPDLHGPIWSGSAVADIDNTCGLVPGGGLVAVFSYRNQSQGIAYSADDGRTWTKYDGNPVIPVGGKDFRDPKVFWHPDIRQWVMVIAAGDHVDTYASPNLIKWVYASSFGSDQGWHGGVWECPDLFPLHVDGQEKWVLLNSLDGAPSGGRGIQYFIGSFDGNVFINDNPPDTTLWLDYGRDNYAGATWNDTPDGSRVCLGWMDDWLYAHDIPTSPWRGAMTIPRRLALKNLGDGPRLVQTPIPQIEQLREPPRTWHSQTIAPGSNVLAGVAGKTLDIVAEFRPGNSGVFAIKVHKSADGSQFTTIGYDATSSTLYVDRTRSGMTDFHAGFAGIHKVTLAPDDGRIKLRILVDWSSVEVFGNDGAGVITDQVFPDAASDQLELFASNGGAVLVSLEIYPLRRTW
jgi:fructan beta-fructosidase